MFRHFAKYSLTFVIFLEGDSHSRDWEKYLSVFPSRVSVTRRSPVWVSLCPKTEFLTIASQEAIRLNATSFNVIGIYPIPPLRWDVTQGLDFCGETLRFLSSQLSTFTQSPNSGDRVQNLSFFLSLVSLARQILEWVVLSPMTEVLIIGAR